MFLAFLTMVLVSYFYVSRIVQRQMLSIGEETMNTTEMAVSSGLTEVELAFSNMTQNIKNMLPNGADKEDILEYLQNTNQYFGANNTIMPEFLKVYAYIGVEFLDGSGWIPPDGYEPTQRPWYIGAVECVDEIYRTEPYVDADTGGMCISFSQQIFDNEGNAYGVVAIDVNLTHITDYIANQEIANSGYGVLIDDDLRFTTHRDANLIGMEMDQAGGEYWRLELMLQEGLDISAERFQDTDGTDSVAFFRTIFNGWHIGVVIPRASYYEQVSHLAAVLGVLGFVLMLILSYMLVRIQNARLRSEEENRSKSTFLSRMSHEMRTPMNAITGMISIAKKTDDADEIQRCLEKINDSANHLLGVINDVLDMSKIEAGKMELSETDFRFQDLVSQVTTVMNFKLEEKKQNFTIQVDDDVPRVVIADKQRLAQVITNLLSNANKFTPEGGNIRLTVRKESEDDGGCRLRIAVEDNGIGISEEQQARLFLSFEQADNSISRKYGGTGLGLAISKRIVNLMNGDIWIESAPGEGSKFIFTILVRIGSEAEIEAPDSERQDSGDITNLFVGKRILLADDVEINREIVIVLLEETGVAIDCAENGKEACDLFAANPELYDLIFMDVHMPEMDGYEAAGTIRKMEHARARTIPIVAMTANVFREDVEKCLAAGMNDHVGKPLEIDTVIAKMKRYMA